MLTATMPTAMGLLAVMTSPLGVVLVVIHSFYHMSQAFATRSSGKDQAAAPARAWDSRLPDVVLKPCQSLCISITNSFSNLET